MKKIFSCFILFVFINTNYTYAQSGNLDLDFNADGKNTTDISNKADYLIDLAFQADGKIVATGVTYNGSSEDFVIVRYTADGNIDNTFGSNGIDTIDFGGSFNVATSLAIQNDGKIIVAGYSYNPSPNNTISICRLYTDGSLDLAFGNNGKIFETALVNAYINSVAILPDGNFIVGGTFNDDFFIMKYKTNGIVDSSFGNNGYIQTDFGSSWDSMRDLQILTDGKIIASGISMCNGSDLDFALAKYNSDGTLDLTFSFDGILSTAIGDSDDNAYGLIIQPDGKILVGGSVYHDGPRASAVARYNANGSLDLSFNTNGIVFTSFGTSTYHFGLALQPDNKIVVAGCANNTDTQNDFALVRLNADASIDSTFGTNGLVTTDFFSLSDRLFSVEIQTDGRIVAVGEASTASASTNLAIARYLSGLNIGIIEFISDENPLFIYPNPIQDFASFDYELLQDETISIELLDISGKKVQSFLLNKSRSKGKHKEILNFGESIITGNYILQIRNSTHSQSIHIIKQ